MPAGYVDIKKESDEDLPMPSTDGYYPYGTMLSFEGDMAEELSVDSYSAGDVVEVRAFAVVKRKSEEAEEEGEVEKCLHLQLTSVKLSKSQTNDRAEQMYGEGE